MNSLRAPAVWFPAVRVGTGSDVFTARLAEELGKRGIQAEITWLPLLSEVVPWVVSIPEPPKWATVAHVNTWIPSRFLPRRLPIVASVHHAAHDPDLRPYLGHLRSAYRERWIAPNERRVLRRANRVVAVSHFAANTARKTLLDVPMQVIYNGVDIERFSPGVRERIEGEPFKLLYVGGWTSQKGADLLAPIMRNLGEGYELYYTGGSISSRERASMPPNAHDVGRLSEPEVISAMQNADALLFPSRSEGFGLAAAEAMACGMPVIGSRSSAFPEIVSDGKTGILCPAGDVAAFADAVRLMAQRAQLAAEMGAAGRARVESKFSMNKTVDEYLNCYSELT